MQTTITSSMNITTVNIEKIEMIKLTLNKVLITHENHIHAMHELSMALAKQK